MRLLSSSMLGERRGEEIESSNGTESSVYEQRLGRDKEVRDGFPQRGETGNLASNNAGRANALCITDPANDGAP